MRDGRSVLVVVDSSEDRARIERLLSAGGDDVVTMADASSFQETTDARAFDLVVLGFPTMGIRAVDFMRLLRWSGSQCRDSVVVVVCGPDHLEDAEELLDHGVSRILNRYAGDGILGTAFAEVTEFDPRLLVRAFVRIPGSDLGLPGMIMTQTLNLSVSGMLVRLNRPVELGGQFSFSIQLPQISNPIRGMAEIVRVTYSGDQETGFAATFSSFEDRDEDILKQFIASQDLQKVGSGR